MDRDIKKKIIIAAIIVVALFGSAKLWKNRGELKHWFDDEPVVKTTPTPSNEGKTGKLIISNDPPLDEQVKKQQQDIASLKAEMDKTKKELKETRDDMAGFAGYADGKFEKIEAEQEKAKERDKQLLADSRSTNTIVKALRRDWLNQNREPEVLQARSGYASDIVPQQNSNSLPTISVDKIAAWFTPDAAPQSLKVLLDIQAINAMGVTLAVIPVIRLMDGREYSLESRFRTFKPTNKSYIANGFDVSIPNGLLPKEEQFNLAFKVVDSNNLAKTLLMTGWKTIKQPNG